MECWIIKCVEVEKCLGSDIQYRSFFSQGDIIPVDLNTDNPWKMWFTFFSWQVRPIQQFTRLEKWENVSNHNMSWEVLNFFFFFNHINSLSWIIPGKKCPEWWIDVELFSDAMKLHFLSKAPTKPRRHNSFLFCGQIFWSWYGCCKVVSGYFLYDFSWLN